MANLTYGKGIYGKWNYVKYINGKCNWASMSL